MTSKFVEIVPPFHRQGNGIPCAAIRWPDFGDRSSFGRPFAQIFRHSGSDVRRRFDRAAGKFEEFDFVHTATRNGLLARLDPMVVEAKTVVDLGCATGSACKPLAKRFRHAQIIALDLSVRMLEQVRHKQSWFTKYSLLHANASAIPLADQSVTATTAATGEVEELGTVGHLNHKWRVARAGAPCKSLD